MITVRKHFDFKGKRILEKLTIEKSFRMGVKFPKEACYVYLLGGDLAVNGVDSKTTLVPKDGVVLNCGYYFADFINTCPHQRSEVLAIHLYPDILREIFRNEMPTFLKVNQKPSLPTKTVNNTVMEKFIDSLLFYFDNPQIVTEDILVLKVRELILLLVQSTHSENIHQLFTALFSRKATTVSEVVNAHLYDNFSVSELAKLAGLSLTSFKEEFAALFSESPARYIRRKKIERAKELLLVSDYSVSEIANQIGYSDLSHFSKSFHALSGCSPGTFRIGARKKLD
ncbi:MAG TPA: AraC family transcriptional regulator [Cyclobacteriaceae bacterium]|nr:AraC family transcriptional regulator [Cyclobacteriaceae bacterium]